MKRISIFCLLFLACSLVPLPSNAQQPTIAVNGIRNGASYALPGLPNAGIAQGSIFVIFGDNMGPATLVQVSAFPLPTSEGLAGTSVSVTVGNTTLNAIMLYTLKTQVAAVLPSNTPVGVGTIRVTYNGQTSASASITVVARSFGTFALNQAGSGPGVIQNVNAELDRPFNGATTPARPGQIMILWGTGIGPLTVGGNETNGAGFGVDMPGVNLKVFVGAQEATVQYRGRSGCCVGIDQIVFTVPAGGIEGCAVPVYLVVDGVVSNFTSISIAASGDTCSDPGGYTSSQWGTAKASGGLRIGALSVGRYFVRGIGAFPFEFRTDSISASYSRVPLETLLQSPGSPPIGSCSVQQFPGYTLPTPQVLNAGTVSVSGPVGNRTLAVQNPGTRYLIFSPGADAGIPGYVTDGTLLTAGTYNFAATAGSEVGAHNASINYPATFTWNEYTTFSTNVSRSQPFTFTWTGGSPGGIVTITGQSQASQGIGAQITCFADAAAGSFTVPAAIMSAIPPTYTDISGIPQGSWAVGQVLIGGSVNIPGIDRGFVLSSEGFNVGPINFQ